MEIPTGLHDRRLRNGVDYREVAFWLQWESEHHDRDGDDLLSHLFRVPCDKTDPKCYDPHCWLSGPYKLPFGWPSHRDRVVAATVIQWLGTNCGMSFLHEALRRVGGGLNWPRREVGLKMLGDAINVPRPATHTPGLEDGRHAKQAGVSG